MSNEITPLVSCICMTHNAVTLLKRSIDCFLNQTYQNKELIVAYTSDNTTTANFLRQFSDPRIINLVIPAYPKLSLGEKRNLAIEKSNGFYFCVWDDDDWYCNDRVEFHVHSLRDRQFKSSVLSKVLIFDGETQEAYLSGSRWAWEQTLLCEKSVTENPTLRYKSLELSEDSPFLFNLRENDLLLTLTNHYLYVYIYHGRNSWHRQHWDENIIQWATKFPEEQSKIVKGILEGKYSNNEASDIIKSFRQLIF